MRGKLAQLVSMNLVDAIFNGKKIDWTKWPIVFTPGYYQARCIAKFINLDNAGDYFHTMMALFAANINVERWLATEEVLNYFSHRLETAPTVPTIH